MEFFDTIRKVLLSWARNIFSSVDNFREVMGIYRLPKWGNLRAIYFELIMHKLIEIIQNWIEACYLVHLVLSYMRNISLHNLLKVWVDAFLKNKSQKCTIYFFVLFWMFFKSRKSLKGSKKNWRIGLDTSSLARVSNCAWKKKHSHLHLVVTRKKNNQRVQKKTFQVHRLVLV